MWWEREWKVGCLFCVSFRCWNRRNHSDGGEKKASEVFFCWWKLSFVVATRWKSTMRCCWRVENEILLVRKLRIDFNSHPFKITSWCTMSRFSHQQIDCSCKLPVWRSWTSRWNTNESRLTMESLLLSLCLGSRNSMYSGNDLCVSPLQHVKKTIFIW